MGLGFRCHVVASLISGTVTAYFETNSSGVYVKASSPYLFPTARRIPR